MSRLGLQCFVLWAVTLQEARIFSKHCFIAIHLCYLHALTMYEKMRAKALQPNEITFVSVLSACAESRATAGSVQLHKEDAFR
ncbi:hypothetical protein MTR67_000265 [Solanum verrucosum]|uniref:Secreted protein n=1 Tax=Solanum verrucosum TaxID=315347 RepID=A0AAF0TBE1_SOLVR|nr:hypothetical protein MTR67_000265 [Solanum verrucosum]